MLRAIANVVVVLMVLATISSGAKLDNEQLAMPNDEQETRLLKQGSQFRDYCLVTRDLIGEMVQKEERVASIVAGALVEGGISLGLTPFEFQEEKLEELARLYKRELSSEDNRLYLTLIGLLDETKNAASRQAINKLEGIASFTGDRIGKHIRRACNTIDEADAGVRRAFNFMEGKVRRQANVEEEEEANVEQVHCQTSMSILQANNICKFALASSQSRQQGLTYQPQFIIKLT